MSCHCMHELFILRSELDSSMMFYMYFRISALGSCVKNVSVTCDSAGSYAVVKRSILSVLIDLRYAE